MLKNITKIFRNNGKENQETVFKTCDFGEAIQMIKENGNLTLVECEKGYRLIKLDSKEYDKRMQEAKIEQEQLKRATPRNSEMNKHYDIDYNLITQNTMTKSQTTDYQYYR